MLGVKRHKTGPSYEAGKLVQHLGNCQVDAKFLQNYDSGSDEDCEEKNIKYIMKNNC